MHGQFRYAYSNVLADTCAHLYVFLPTHNGMIAYKCLQTLVSICIHLFYKAFIFHSFVVACRTAWDRPPAKQNTFICGFPFHRQVVGALVCGLLLAMFFMFYVYLARPPSIFPSPSPLMGSGVVRASCVC
jgi:hypothetical protein